MLRPRVADPNVGIPADGLDPACPDCQHTNGEQHIAPFRALARKLGIPLKVKLIECGDTQWYESDEFSCACRNSIHSA